MLKHRCYSIALILLIGPYAPSSLAFNTLPQLQVPLAPANEVKRTQSSTSPTATTPATAVNPSALKSAVQPAAAIPPAMPSMLGPKTPVQPGLVMPSPPALPALQPIRAQPLQTSSGLPPLAPLRPQVASPTRSSSQPTGSSTMPVSTSVQPGQAVRNQAKQLDEVNLLRAEVARLKSVVKGLDQRLLAMTLQKPFCSDVETSTNKAGQANDCTPFACDVVTGSCLHQANSSNDCAPGFLWYDGHQCVHP